MCLNDSEIIGVRDLKVQVSIQIVQSNFVYKIHSYKPQNDGKGLKLDLNFLKFFHFECHHNFSKSLMSFSKIKKYLIAYNTYILL